MRHLPLVLLAAIALAPAGESALPEGVVDSQKPADIPTTAAVSLTQLTVPSGFTVTQVAAEPMIGQPIALSFDARGRLWVAECFSYTSKGKWDGPAKDRISVLHDRDGDGKADAKTVFLDNARNLTGLTVGFGGVWACMTPNLVFIPDRDGDLRPDGPPEVVLDGWDDTKAGHNVFNGLCWGPDGWLYGCQGIQCDSKVGAPGTAPEARTRFGCGIWRYHPVTKTFAVVCEGTTNPFGLDFDERGQGFFTNCVTDHCWHAIPGARYQRMYGKDLLANAYALMTTCADHRHFAGGSWNKAISGPAVDAVGGGHAHAGSLVYLGDDWPASWRGALLMNNIHGRRINVDRPRREGSGFVVGHDDAVPLRSADPWFKGVALTLGPDGAVWLSDWCDFGECHDHDGVHRSTGRLYRLSHGAKPPAADLDLAKLDDAALAELHRHRNEWQVRTARRLLQERAAAGKVPTAAHSALRAMLAGSDALLRLKALWTLHATGGLDAATLTTLAGDPDEDVRHWAVRLLDDGVAPTAATTALLVARAKADPSPFIRLALAGRLRDLPAAQRWDLAEALIAHAEDANDKRLPLLYWYGLEAAIPTDKPRALRLAQSCPIGQIREFITRRVVAP